MNNVLLIETAFLGDAILSLALAEAIHSEFLHAHISILVRPEAVSLLKYSPSLANVIAFDKYGKESGMKGVEAKANELNTYDFDAIFCLHNSKRTSKLLRRLHAPIKVGFSSARHVRSELTHLVEDEQGEWKVKRLQSLLNPFVIQSTKLHLPLLDLHASSALTNIASKGEYITISPGSAWATKQWGAEKFAELSEMLMDEGCTIVMVGSKADRGVADEIIAMGLKQITDVVGKTTTEEAAAIIAHSQLIITNDSAPVHIALATNVHSFILLGPTVREFGFVPPKEYSTVFEDVNLWCRPCASHGGGICPIYTHECMKNIAVENVVNSVLQYLKKQTTVTISLP